MFSSKIGRNSPSSSSSSSSSSFFFFFFFLRNWPTGLLGRRWEVILSQIFSGIVCARSFHYYDRRTSRPLLSLTRTISDLNKEPWKWCHFLIDHAAVKEGVAGRGRGPVTYAIALLRARNLKSLIRAIPISFHFCEMIFFSCDTISAHVCLLTS